MKPKKISLHSIVIVALLSTGYSSITPAAENLCDIADAPDADLSTLADDLQKKIDKLTALQKSWKEDNAQFIKAADADEASLILLKVATTLKAASSSILAVGGVIGGGAVAASPALLVTAAISNTVGVFNDEANATNKEDLLVKYNVDNIILAQEYKTAIGIAEESKFVSAWSKLSTWSGVVADNMEAIKTLATKSTLRSKLNSMNNQYNKFLNNDIATLKSNLAKVKKSIDKTDKKLGKDVLDLIKKTKKNTVESCQKLNPEPTNPNEPPIIIEPKGEGYTKIANDGSTLPDSAVLGTAPTDWACTKDNATGLIWEVKTNDGSLRDMNKGYTNYTADYPKCDNATFGETGVCLKNGFTGKLGDNNNTDGFISAVNSQGLCGKNDWRLPTRDELQGLVYCSDGKYNKLTEEAMNSKGYGYVCASNENSLTTTSPTINATYFPNTQQYLFWSSSPFANVSSYAWSVSFDSGYSNFDFKYGGFSDGRSYVRLVHE